MIKQSDLKESGDIIIGYIEEEINNVPNQDPSRVFFGGVSQGCMVASAIYFQYNGT